MTDVKSAPFKEFTRRQSDLNRFLWTTELIYGIVKQERILAKYPQGKAAWDVLKDVRSAAWFPPTKAQGRRGTKASVKYKGTIGQMREQLDKNFAFVLWTVAAMFVAEFESFVEARFPKWVKAYSKEGRAFTVPAPAPLLRSLCKCYGLAPGAGIDASITLKADLMKKIRNLYVHKGLRGIPRKLNDPEIVGWIAMIAEKSPYSADEARSVARDVIGGAIGKSRATGKKGEPLGEEFFYALFTLTNIRKFAMALDAGFPADG